jgi:uncharacterized protein YbaR (Trm112 family)
MSSEALIIKYPLSPMFRHLAAGLVPFGSAAYSQQPSSSDSARNPRELLTLNAVMRLLGSDSNTVTQKNTEHSIERDSRQNSIEFVDMTMSTIISRCMNDFKNGKSLLVLADDLNRSDTTDDKIQLSTQLVLNSKKKCDLNNEATIISEVKSLLSDNAFVTEVLEQLTCRNSISKDTSRPLKTLDATCIEYIELCNEHKCAFCLDILACPHNINCGHSFCADCLEKYLDSDQVDIICCPVCREEVAHDGVYERKLDEIIFKMVENLNPSAEKVEWMRRHKRIKSQLSARHLKKLGDRHGFEQTCAIVSIVLVVLLATILAIRRR